jgi:hypothetical protein
MILTCHKVHFPVLSAHSLNSIMVLVAFLFPCSPRGVVPIRHVAKSASEDHEDEGHDLRGVAHKNIWDSLSIHYFLQKCNIYQKIVRFSESILRVGSSACYSRFESNAWCSTQRVSATNFPGESPACQSPEGQLHSMRCLNDRADLLWHNFTRARAQDLSNSSLSARSD